MRCREVRNRIDSLAAQGKAWTDDPVVKEHLDRCAGCTAYVTASSRLSRLLTVGCEDDAVNPTPIEMQRQQVEARVASGRTPSRTRTVAWSWLPDLSMTHHPVLRMGIAVAVLLITAVSIVPFTVHHTVGYDLNLDGVDHHLVQDDQQICDLLTGLGLVEAGVDRCGCNTTSCCLSILDLKTEQEAVMVVGAIARLNEDVLTTRITPIRAKASRSLLQRASEIFRRGSS